MESSADIGDKVSDIVRLYTGVKDISLDSRLEDDLGADKLDMSEIIIETEEEFDICISAEDADRFVTLGDIVDCVERKTVHGETIGQTKGK